MGLRRFDGLLNLRFNPRLRSLGYGGFGFGFGCGGFGYGSFLGSRLRGNDNIWFGYGCGLFNQDFCKNLLFLNFNLTDLFTNLDA